MIAEQPNRPDSLKPMDAWLDMDSFSEPWACDLVRYAQKLERRVVYLRRLLECARDHMTGDGFAFDVKQDIDRAMEKAE